MNIGRLDPLFLLPPPTDRPWHALSRPSPSRHLQRADGSEITIDLPLFWYAPDWYQLPASLAAVLASSVASRKVMVASLRSEITPPGEDSKLHDAPELPRMVPYRPERFGFDIRDLDGARVIDLRLTLAHEPSGRLAFPPTQIARWESESGQDVVSGGGWVESASFPPDVRDFTHLGSKIAQLRQLSPQAAVFVSLNPIQLEADLRMVLDADPDGVILRLDRFPISGLKLAGVITKTRQWMTRYHSAGLPLWVVPGQVTADDSAKIMALGASAVAIDSWCVELRDKDLRTTAQRLGLVGDSDRVDADHVDELVGQHLAERIKRFTGLLVSTPTGELSDRLGTFEESWAESLGVRLMG